MAMMILIINDDYDDDDDEDVNDDDGDDDDDNPSSDGRCASVILNWILCSGENRARRIPFDSWGSSRLLFNSNIENVTRRSKPINLIARIDIIIR